MSVEEVDSSKRDSDGKKSRVFYSIGYAFLVAMALFWSVDSAIVYIFSGIACFFLFLGFNARTRSVEKSYARSYRPPGRREYPGSTEPVEDKIKQFFQHRTSSGTTRPMDAMVKGRKVALAIAISFFVLFTIPFMVALFGRSGSPDSIYYYMVATQYFEAQQYDSAYREYKRALAIDPDYIEAIVGYGDVLVIRNERDSAILMFDRALELDPDYSEATYKKAAAWYDQRKYNEAIGILTPLLVDEPEYYNAMLLMGDCYYARKNFVDALAWYESAYQNVHIRTPNLCYLMGYIYETSQNYEKAIALYKETLTYDDTIADIYERLGYLIPGAEGDAYRTKAIELKR